MHKKIIIVLSLLSAGADGAQQNQKTQVNRVLDVVSPVLPIQGIIKDYLDNHDQYEMHLGDFSRDSSHIAFSGDGLKAAFAKFVAAAAGKISIYIYDLKKRQLEREYIVSFHDLPIDQQKITALALSHDGKNIAYTHGIGLIRFLSNENRMEEIASNQIGHSIALGLAYSPDGHFIACSGGVLANNSRQNCVTIWDLKNKKIAHSLVFSYPALEVSYSPDGKFLAATQYYTNAVDILNTEKYSVVKTLTASNTGTTGDNKKLRWLAYAYRGNHLAITSNKSEYCVRNASKAIEIWDLARNRCIDEKVFTSFINKIAYSTDNRYFAVCKKDLPIELFGNQAVEITQADEAAERQAMRKPEK